MTLVTQTKATQRLYCHVPIKKSRKGESMLDRDLDYCDQQIEAQEEKVRALHSARIQAKNDMLEANKVLESARKEKNRTHHVYQVLESKFGHERRILKGMTTHRKKLKLLKKLQQNQNDYIDKKAKKCEQSL